MFIIEFPQVCVDHPHDISRQRFATFNYPYVKSRERESQICSDETGEPLSSRR